MASNPTVSDSNSLVKLYHPPYVSLAAAANWKNFPVVPVGRDWLTLPGARRRARAAPISPLPCKFFPKYAPCPYSATVNDVSQRPKSNHQICARVQLLTCTYSCLLALASSLAATDRNRSDAPTVRVNAKDCADRWRFVSGIRATVARNGLRPSPSWPFPTCSRHQGESQIRIHRIARTNKVVRY